MYSSYVYCLDIDNQIIFHILAACTGITAGIAVGCLALSLVFTFASVVITLLCTRRCYKKSSHPSSNEKSVYYKTVQSDSVQMQPSPAYESVDKVK